MNSNFIHLHLHSEYSICDSLIRIEDLIDQASENKYPAIAITDSNNIFSLIKFYKTAIKKGIKPIIGIEVDIEDFDDENNFSKVILLCKNITGFNNLSSLITDSYVNLKEDRKFVISRDSLAKKSRGLIALSGGINGDIAKALKLESDSLIEKCLNYWKKNFPNSFYIEITRTGRDFEEEYLSHAIELSEKYNLPLVASNDVRFLDENDFQAHEVRVCINNGSYLNDEQRKSIYNKSQFLKSSSQMEELFSDLPSAIQNSYEIAKRCNIQLPLGEINMPIFPLENNVNENEYFSSLVMQKLEKKIRDQNIQNIEPYKNRIKIELDVIIKMGYSGYFLIVSDFVIWAKNNSIPVGPGRGSGAGSLVAYVLNITNIDPIKYDLLFERFLNQERVSLPDFDIDFCMDKRDKVIDYVSRKYGQDKVSQIITYGTMAAKAVVRDVGRVLQYPYGFVDQIAKLIPFEIGITLSKALEDKELKKLYDSDDDVKEIIDMAMVLEGLPRNAGTHAGGVVISPKKLINYTPLYRDTSSSTLLTQLDKDDVEEIGLIKLPHDIFNLDFERISKLEGWGSLSVDNLKKSIQKSKKVSLDKFIFSLGIRHIGQENAKLIAKHLQKKENFLNIDKKYEFNSFVSIDGIGEIQISSIRKFFSLNENLKVIKELSKHLNIENEIINNSGKFKNLSFMITGKLVNMSRAEIKSIIEKNSGKILSSVNKKLDFLIIGDKPTTKKVNQANDLGIKIINQEELNKLLN